MTKPAEWGNWEKARGPCPTGPALRELKMETLQHCFVQSDAKSRGILRDDVTVLRGGSVEPQDIPGITDMVGMELGKIRPVPGRD